MEETKIYKCTDAGNSERLSDKLNNKYLYVPEKAMFVKYDGKLWRDDAEKEITQDTITVFRQAQYNSLNIEDEDRRQKALKWLLASESQSRISAAISLMSSIQGLCVRMNMFDTDDMLLNVQNGTIDLRTGELKSHTKENYLTKICNVSYNPNSRSEYFETFLYEIMEGSTDKIAYMQRLFGYFLSGRISEEEFYIMKGSGGNGKTKLLEAVKYALGTYCITASPEILMAKDMNSIPNDIARLQGARLVIMSEPDPGKRFSDNAIKSLTGGDTIVARFLHKEFFEFNMKGKICMLTNHDIRAIGTDNGLWRRIVNIPFTYEVPEEKKDKNLIDKLINDSDAILNWMVKGCLLWQKEGLKQPQELIQAKNEYRMTQDAIGMFVEDCCIKDTQGKILKSDLYSTFLKWCQDNGEYELSQRQLSMRLQEKGFEEHKGTGGARYWKGISLNSGKVAFSGLNSDILSKENIYRENRENNATKCHFATNEESPWWEKAEELDKVVS